MELTSIGPAGFEIKDNDVTKASIGSIEKVTLSVAVLPYWSVYVAITSICFAWLHKKGYKF